MIGPVKQMSKIFGGDLRNISLGSLLQLTRAEGINGWVYVEPRGVITLHAGEVVGVQCGPLRGDDALRELLFLEAGRFALVRGRPTGAGAAHDLMHLIMDAYRLRDEWARLSTAVLRRAHDAWPTTGGPVDQVIAALDGQTPLARIVAELSLAVTPLVDALRTALEDGHVERVRPGRENVAHLSPAAPPTSIPRRQPSSVPRGAGLRLQASMNASGELARAAERALADLSDFDSLVDRGRALLRGNELSAAEASFRRALELRPGDRAVLQNLRALDQRRSSAVEAR